MKWARLGAAACAMLLAAGVVESTRLHAQEHAPAPGATVSLEDLERSFNREETSDSFDPLQRDDGGGPAAVAEDGAEASPAKRRFGGISSLTGLFRRKSDAATETATQPVNRAVYETAEKPSKPLGGLAAFFTRKGPKSQNGAVVFASGSNAGAAGAGAIRTASAEAEIAAPPEANPAQAAYAEATGQEAQQQYAADDYAADPSAYYDESGQAVAAANEAAVLTSEYPAQTTAAVVEPAASVPAQPVGAVQHAAVPQTAQTAPLKQPVVLTAAQRSVLASRGAMRHTAIIRQDDVSDAGSVIEIIRDSQEDIPLPPGQEPEVTTVPAPAPESTVIIDEGEYIEGNSYFWGDVWNGCRRCCRSGLVGGVELTFLAPTGEPNQQVILTDLVNNVNYQGNTDTGLGFGFRAWAGLQRCGWGFRVGYWQLNNNLIDPEPVVPLNAEAAFVESNYIQAYAIDVELTQRLCLCNWIINTSFGGRHAILQRNSTVLGYGTLGNVDVTGIAMGAHEIEGTGFTFSVFGRKPIGCSCWSLYCGFRGSVLWADSTASALTEATAITKAPFAAAAANSRDKASASKDHSETVTIAEVQAGIQFAKRLHCLPCRCFMRAGFEYQHWETGDVFAKSNSFAFLQGGGPPSFGGQAQAFAQAHDGDLDLIGFTVGAGLTY